MPKILNSIPARIRWIAALIIVILAGYFVARFLFIETQSIPPEFLKARTEASLIAQDIVNLSNQTSENLAKVAELDNQRNYTEALVLVSQELERNREARQKAVGLSVQLEQMTKNISSISPQSASQKALEALTSETALIGTLITYNEYLNQLLEALRNKFVEKEPSQKIPELISKINQEAKTINELNAKFSEAMEEFDSRW